MLEATRVDMMSVLGPMIATEGESADMISIETDLMNPAFRETLAASGGLPFAALLGVIDELRAELCASTGRPLLDGGGFHLMRYPPGSKFMRHVDEDASLHEPVRNSISFLVYLTPTDWRAEDGGALRVFERGAAAEPRAVQPFGGTLVVYDSALEHEVSVTRRERLLVSGRFRELDADWQRGRSGAGA